MDSQKIIRFDDFVKRPRSRRANLVARGVLKVRRSDREMKRNAEIGLFRKSSRCCAPPQRSCRGCGDVERAREVSYGIQQLLEGKRLGENHVEVGPMHEPGRAGHTDNGDPVTG